MDKTFQTFYLLFIKTVLFLPKLAILYLARGNHLRLILQGDTKQIKIVFQLYFSD